MLGLGKGEEMGNRSIKCLRANKRIMVGIVVLAMIFCLVQSPNAYGGGGIV